MAYIFLHLFPELSEGQRALEESLEAVAFIENHVYLMALVGLAFFYGLERFVVNSKEKAEQQGNDKKASGLFWIHIGSFAIYNALIGYLLFQREEGPIETLMLFSIAMALHFIVNDFGLQEHHHESYRKVGRWVLVIAIVVGWAVGYIIVVSEAAVAMVMAFIGGGVVLNVLKEELPEQRKSRYWAFILGAFLYAILLLSL